MRQFLDGDNARREPVIRAYKAALSFYGVLTTERGDSVLTNQQKAEWRLGWSPTGKAIPMLNPQYNAALGRVSADRATLSSLTAPITGCNRDRDEGVLG